MSLENFTRQPEQNSEIGEFPKIENSESQRPSEIELPSVRKLETESSYKEAERPDECELPHFEGEKDLDMVMDGEVNSDTIENNSVDNNDVSERNDVAKNCPIENGSWEGERGNSKWIPDPEYVPQKKNPEQKTWKQILNEYGIESINFKDGEPDFSEISKGDVEIEPFSTNRDDNFDKADIELAKQKGCTPEEVAKWRKEHGYTWHECKDMKTMQKVPSIIHNNISHRGGISEAKGGN